MTELIPYFAGLVTIGFGVAFYLGLQEFKKIVAPGKPWKPNTEE